MLLKAAVEDNVAWCAAVSATHGAQAIQMEAAWANLATAPRYYPNVITRAPGAQAAVTALIGRLHGSRPWSIKDSFRDLDLHHLGFKPVIEAQWLGGIPVSDGTKWERARTSADLAHWSEAWGEGTGTSPFMPALLADPRIGFWQLRRSGAITAGGVTFASGPVVGLSNWFAGGNAGTAFSLGLMAAIATAYPGFPIVLWTEEETAELEKHGLKPLGKLRVWTAS